MRRLMWILLAIVMVPLAHVSAQTIYSTGFEDPPFTAGQPLVGQDGWQIQIYGGNPLGPNALISTASPKSGSQSVRLAGADLTPTDLGYAVGSYRQFVNYDVAGAGFPVIRVAADVRIDGPATTQTEDRVSGDFFSTNLKAFSNDGGLGEISLSSDGHVYGYTNSDSYLFGSVVSPGEYHRLALDLDFVGKTTTFSVDGIVLGTVAFDDGFDSTILSRGSLLAYGLDPDAQNRELTDYTAYYDNFSITGVPEPSTWVLATAGIASVSMLRRRSLRRGKH